MTGVGQETTKGKMTAHKIVHGGTLAKVAGAFRWYR